MHILQKHILDQLRQANQLRYSEMQPDHIESSHFKYHLNQLIKDGLVELQSRGIYSLTIKGQATVDRLSAGKVNPHATPKVITYTLLFNDTYYYLQRKDKQPYLGLLNMIGGKVHIGETSQEAAIREVQEKTGLTVARPTLAGVAEIITKDDHQLVTHAVAYVYTQPVKNTDNPHLTAVPKDTLINQPDLAPDTLQLIKTIEQTQTGSVFTENLIVHL